MELLSHPNDLQKAACIGHHSCSSLPRSQPWQCWEDLPLIWKHTHDFTGKSAWQHLLMKKKRPNSASWPILVIIAIQVWVGVFFPPNGSGIFKETQKLFSWQEPNLAAGQGKVATDHQRVPGGKELHIPPLPAASSCPFPSPGSLDTPISIS